MNMPAEIKTFSSESLTQGGKVLVDATRCPRLHAALTRGLVRVRSEWDRVVDLRRAGDLDKADRVAARLLGVKGEPMDEETKAKLRAYAEEHKDEIAAKRRLRSAILKRARCRHA
jgi:hypothetical protein